MDDGPPKDHASEDGSRAGGREGGKPSGGDDGWQWWKVVIAHAGLGTFDAVVRVVVKNPKVLSSMLSIIMQDRPEKPTPRLPAPTEPEKEYIFMEEIWVNKRTGEKKRRPTLRLGEEIILRLASKGFTAFQHAPIDVLPASDIESVGVIDDHEPENSKPEDRIPFVREGETEPISIKKSALRDFVSRFLEKNNKASPTIREGLKNLSETLHAQTPPSPAEDSDKPTQDSENPDTLSWFLGKYGWVFGAIAQAAGGVYIRRRYDTEDTSEGWAKWAQMLIEFLLRFAMARGIELSIAALCPALLTVAPFITSAAQCGLTFLWPRLRRWTCSFWGWMTGS